MTIYDAGPLAAGPLCGLLKLCPITPVTGLPGRVPGQKDLRSLGSEDST